MISDYEEGFRAECRGREVQVTLLYPPRDEGDKPNKPRYVIFDQESVRASDGIRLHYDYERDGYVVEQASKFSWRADDGVCDRDWQEVAFVQAWGREEGEDS